MKKESMGISIIIPCYNVEEYISSCLDSIEKQNIGKNYEIILVDDCSTDNTEKVITEYRKKTKLNIVYRKNEKNSGAGYSRNRAIEIAKYDYISFIDSDDFIDDNYYKEMLSVLKKASADVVVCDINCVYEEENKELLFPSCNGKVTKYNFIDTGFAASPCNKIIKRQLLKKYPFAEGIMNEDIASIIAILANCKKIAYTNKTKYNYVQHASSVQNSPLSEKRFDIFKSLSMLEERIKKNPSFEKFMQAIIFHQIIEFFLYVPIKEDNYFTRARFLKKFSKLSKKYQMRQNPLFWQFLENNTPKNRLYYKTIAKLNCNGFSYSTSFIMSLYRIYKKIQSIPVIKKDITLEDLIFEAKRQKDRYNRKTVSVVIPNYNYAHFMYQRLYSILYQKYKVNEIIILDDCSTDNSREVIDKIVESLSPYINIKKVYNEKNSKCVFKQWEKGFKLAKSEYVWIAEADDYCTDEFLKLQFKKLEMDSNIVLSYVDTAMINTEGSIFMRSCKSDIDVLQSGHWDQSFVVNGKDEIKNYAYINCTIANVSSVIFKKEDYSLAFKEATKYKQVGDWRFYLGVFEKGKISYINKACNFYRVHGNNVTSNTKKQKHFEEIVKIHEEYAKIVRYNKIQKKNIKEREDFLKKAWNLDV